MIRADIAIVGAGMAGASLAGELAARASVALIEAEDQPGYHATGRSAAFWSETYGGPAIQPLTSASREFLETPPSDFAETGFLNPRGALHLADEDGVAALDRLAAEFEGSGVALEWRSRADLEAILPGLRSPWARGLGEPSCADIDVAALHMAYLRQARRGGAQILYGARLTTAERAGGCWRLTTTAGPVAADILVDAAGAWAGEVARLCGARPIPIRPFRRTMIQVRCDPPPPAELPLIIDAAGCFYFKPESGGRLWLSPHDETPAEPGDVQAEELDIAVAIDRFERVVDWTVRARERAWAGLRSFAPDRAPVYGFDDRAPGFFWFAGQGGFGIQTAPTAARLGAALLLGETIPGHGGIDADRYAPIRFALARFA